MDKEEALSALKQIKKQSTGDQETDHSRADRILLRLIHDKEITRAFDDISKWYA